MSDQIKKLETFIQSLIDHANAATQDEYDAYLRRNLAFYGWLLQGENLSIERDLLTSFISPQLEQHRQLVNFVLNVDFKNIISSSSEKAVTFSSEAMTAIENVYNNNTNKYFISEELPFLDKIPGRLILLYLYMLRPPVAGKNLVDIVASGLTNALTNIDIDVPHRSLDNIRLVTGPNKSWQFLLAAYPHLGALDSANLYKIMAEISLARNILDGRGLSNLKVLLLAGNVDKADVHFLENFDHVYFVWNLSILRFFHLMKETIDGKTQLAAEHFMSIFSGSSKEGFSTRKAFGELKKKLN